MDLDKEDFIKRLKDHAYNLRVLIDHIYVQKAGDQFEIRVASTKIAKKPTKAVEQAPLKIDFESLKLSIPQSSRHHTNMRSTDIFFAHEIAT